MTLSKNSIYAPPTSCSKSLARTTIESLKLNHLKLKKKKQTKTKLESKKQKSFMKNSIKLISFFKFNNNNYLSNACATVL